MLQRQFEGDQSSLKFPLHRIELHSSERSQIPPKCNSKPVTPSVTRVNAEKTQLPQTPQNTPLPAKRPPQRPSLRNRIFRSKTDLREVKQEPEPPIKSLVKKNSLIRFWRSKPTNKKDDHSKTKQNLSCIFGNHTSPRNNKFHGPT